ncbi:MAG: Hsp20/alpha crystallin family protein [Bacillota bacterium]
MFGLTPYNKRNNAIERRPRDIFDIAGYFEDFFNDSFFPSFYGSSGMMKVDIKENEKEYIISADLPGVNKEEINIDLKYDRLTISVERNEQINEEKENYIRRERRFGSMSRSFYVENVVEGDIKAKFENGVLSIVLPKREASTVKRSRIEIE